MSLVWTVDCDVSLTIFIPSAPSWLFNLFLFVQCGYQRQMDILVFIAHPLKWSLSQSHLISKPHIIVNKKIAFDLRLRLQALHLTSDLIDTFSVHMCNTCIKFHIGTSGFHSSGVKKLSFLTGWPRHNQRIMFKTTKFCAEKVSLTFQISVNDQIWPRCSRVHDLII